MNNVIERRNRRAVVCIRLSIVIFIGCAFGFSLLKAFLPPAVVEGCNLGSALVLVVLSIYGIRCAQCPRCGRRIADTVVGWRKLSAALVCGEVPRCQLCKGLSDLKEKCDAVMEQKAKGVKV